MLIILIIAILCVVGFVVFKNNQTKKRLEEERLRKIAEEEERQRQIALEEERRAAARRAEIEAGKELYHYLNQSIKTMFYHYRTEKWEELSNLGAIELQDREAAKRCIDKMTDDNKKLVKNFLACVDFDDSLQGEGNVTDAEELKKVFESMMLPFFPVFYRAFLSGPRYISFLNQDILKVFTYLSGKKFRPGYKNRYQNGQIAFEWKANVYRVFAADGSELCKASFKDGKVWDGSAILRDEEKSEENWDVYQKGFWKEGVLVKEDLNFNYKLSI